MTDITGLREDKRPQSSRIVHALLDRLEAAEKERDELRNEIACVKEVEFPRKAQAVADAWKGKCERLEAERDALRAKIEAMEQQKPVAFALYSGWARKAVYLSEIEACEQRDHRQLTADLGGSLEAYPEAEGQPPVLRQMSLEHDLYWYSPGAVRQMQSDLLTLLADIKRCDIQNYSLDLTQDIRARIERALNGWSPDFGASTD